MIAHKMIDLNGIDFYYAEAAGPGPVLVLLIGFNDSIESYLPILPELSTVAHVYTLDFRGHGQSGHTPHEYTLRNHVSDTEQFMQKVTGIPAILAGHSMGGWVAAWTTARNPNWVKGLIIEDAEPIFSEDEEPGYPAFTPFRDQILAFKSSGKSFEEFAEAVAQSPAPEVYKGKTRMEVYGKEGAYRHAKQRWSMDVTHYDSVIDGSEWEGYVAAEILPLIQCPMRFITNNVWTPTNGLAAISGSTHVVIDTVDHRVHEMRPREYVQAVKDFIQAL